MEASDPCVPLGAHGRTALLLVRAGALLDEVADDKLAAAQLNGRDYTILSILSTDGPDSQLELARLLGKAPAIVVASVDGLEDSGFVQRTRDPSDRRRSRVTLTPAGATALQRADGIAQTAVADLLSGLDATGLEQLHDLLAQGLGLPAARPTPAAA
jgi:DNA-binding MarR family transcriptional regulator